MFYIFLNIIRSVHVIFKGSLANSRVIHMISFNILRYKNNQIFEYCYVLL